MRARLPLRELHREITAGRLTAEALLRGYLDRIAEREPDVQAWAWLDPQQALAAAQAVDATSAPGLLRGMPIGIKDVIDTADMPTAYGSPIYEGHRPVADAAVVAAIRNAGGIVPGKNVTCEFAGGLPSRTRNPLNPAHTPGGSSAGSAAAVAAGMVPAALGTQTAGSIVRPASFCGVVGYKPSYGLINRAGMKPLSESVDTIGTFTATVDDAAWLVAAISERPELADISTPVRPPRLALCRTDKWSVADADGQRALELAAKLLARAGAEIVDTELPFACATAMEAGMNMIATDARRAFGHELRTTPDLLSQKMRDFVAMGEAGTSTRYDAAQQLLAGQRAQLDAEIFSRFDAILTLSAPGEAPRDLTITGNASFNFVWTLMHGPCINVPGLAGQSGMPVGIQLAGKRGSDAGLLRVAHWVEQRLRQAE